MDLPFYREYDLPWTSGKRLIWSPDYRRNERRYQLIVGPKGVAGGQGEVKNRRTGVREEIALDGLSTKTDEKGRYSFEICDASQYIVQEVVHSDWVTTTVTSYKFSSLSGVDVGPLLEVVHRPAEVLRPQDHHVPPLVRGEREGDAALVGAFVDGVDEGPSAAGDEVEEVG